MILELLKKCYIPTSFSRGTTFTLDILIFDRFAIPITRALGGVLWISPNMVTVLSGLLGVMSAAFYLFGQPVIGFLLMFSSVVLDSVDGNLARMRQQFSPIGARLDQVTDSIKKVLILLVMIYLTTWNHFVVAVLVCLHYLLLRFFPNKYGVEKTAYFSEYKLECYLEPYDFLLLLIVFGPLVYFELTLVVVILLQVFFSFYSRKSI